MQEVFLKLIEQLNSSVFLLFLILIVMGYVLVKVTKYTTLIALKFQTQDTHANDLKTLSETVIKVQTTLELVYNNTNPRSTIRANSPISLTDIGKEVVAQINGQAILDKNFLKLKDFLSEEKMGNAYDIQTSCLNVVKAKLESL
jgi:hypothetical protein